MEGQKKVRIAYGSGATSQSEQVNQGSGGESTGSGEETC